MNDTEGCRLSNILMGSRYSDEDLNEMGEILSDMSDRYDNAKLSMGILLSMGLAAILMGILIPSWMLTVIGVIWSVIGIEIFQYHYIRYGFVRNLHNYVLMFTALGIRWKNEAKEEKHDSDDA